MPELPKTYDPSAVEPKWYQRWLERGDFEADATSAKPAFSIVIPPPNITGVLTLGHVLNNTIQDILSRKARMDGKEVLWLPGTDHAGIATQVQVEKALKKEEKLKGGRDFQVVCLDGVSRTLVDLSDWDLLNLPVETVPQLAVNLSDICNLPLSTVG